MKISLTLVKKKCEICKKNGTSKAKLKTGACIQCAKVCDLYRVRSSMILTGMQGKCVRAYHVSCADAAGIYMLEDDNGLRQCFCPTHDLVGGPQTFRLLRRFGADSIIISEKRKSVGEKGT